MTGSPDVKEMVSGRRWREVQGGAERALTLTDPCGLLLSFGSVPPGTPGATIFRSSRVKFGGLSHLSFPPSMPIDK
jgi:hypothetical protein